jgi:hypothetical protein
MNLGEILDRTFQVYRSKFLVFAGIAALPALAMMGLHIVETPWLHGPSTIYLTRRGVTLWNFAVSLGFYHVASFLGLLVFPALVHLASTTLFGERGSFSTALRFSMERWRSYLWIAVLKLSAVLVLPEILVSVLFAGAAVIADRVGALNGKPTGFLVLLMLGLPALAGCVLFLWLGSCLALAVPACALEGVGGFKAMRRSWVLSRGSRARIILAWLAVAAAGFSGSLLARWVMYFAFRFSGGGWGTWHGLPLYSACFSLASAFVSSLIGPVYPIALTLFYYDQRIRHEGYDIERMMEEAGMTAPSTPLGGDSPPVPVEGEFQP